MDRRSWVVIGALLLAQGACGRLTGRTGEMSVDDRPVRVYVVNYYALPVDIYAIGSGTSLRMGTVNPGMTRTFVVPQSMIGQGVLRFLAEPANGGRAASSSELLLSPGAEVDFEVTAQLVNSIATVRP